MNAVLDIFKIETFANKLNPYFGKCNSKFKSLKELDSAYRVEKKIASTSEKTVLEKYNRFFSNKFTPKDTIVDILDTVFHKNPKFCSDLKSFVSKKKKPDKDQNILSIIQTNVRDPVLGILATCIFKQKYEIWMYGKEYEEIISKALMTTNAEEKGKLLKQAMQLLIEMAILEQVDLIELKNKIMSI